MHAYYFVSSLGIWFGFVTDSSKQNQHSPDVHQVTSTHGATDEPPLEDEDDEIEDEEQRRTMAALEFELLKYLTDNWNHFRAAFEQRPEKRFFI